MIKAAQSEAGFSLVEVLVGMAIASFVSIGVAMSLGVSLKAASNARYNHTARQLASEKIEQLSQINPELLNDTYDDSEVVIENGVRYTIETDVSIHADRTREAEVLVYTQDRAMNGRVSMTAGFALWGKR